MFEIYTTENSITVDMSPNLDFIDQADDHITNFVQSLDVPVDLFALRILIRESVLNAVEHGCHDRSDGKVHINLMIEPEQVVLTVRDDGAGFDWQSKPEYHDELAEGGRGLALMEIYSNCMDYNDSGNELVLKLINKVETALNRN